jgi:3-oxoacyl-[acyl-carrier-protein] synthase III
MGDPVNIRQVAALLRELADAIEQEEPKRPRKRRVDAPAVEVSAEATEAARRALRKAGVAA